VTTRPELVSAQIGSTLTPAQANNTTTFAGTEVRYTFDETVLTATPANFQLVRSDGTLLDEGQQLVSVSGNVVTIRFTTVNATVDTTAGGALANVNNYTLATVEANAASDAQGQTSPEGDAAVGTAAASTTTAVANTTTAPDLRSVGGFRQANANTEQGGLANATAVDFTFDQAAFITAAPSFNLVTVTGEVLPCTVTPGVGSTTASGGTLAGGTGTTTITVLCQNPSVGSPAAPRTTPITASEIARAFVGAGSVAETLANAASAANRTNDNPLQSASVTGGGATTLADLVSAQFLPNNTGTNTTANDQVLFTFDQAVTGLTVGAVNDAFNLFLANGDEVQGGTVTGLNTAGTQVLVTYGPASLTNAVGASVETVGNVRPASVGVTPARAGSSSRTPGAVAAPELRAVVLATSTNALGVVSATATYTFDQAIGAAVTFTADQSAAFNLYLADGTLLNASACAVPTNALATNTQVVCSAFVSTTAAQNTNNGGATAANIASAVLGTVERGAVTGTTASGNTNPNPIGAEPTTGARVPAPPSFQQLHQ
jgi:hypothetical protein